MLPPPVTATPAAASRSCSVVVTTIVAGNPLCAPNSPDAKTLRAMAFSASWLRWPAERVSPCTASSPGSPSTRVFVVRVAHPGGGQFGEHRFDGGARFRVEQAVHAAHPI